MAGPAAVRSGQRRRGRPPGIRAALIVRVRRAAGRVSSVDSSSTMAFAGGCGQAAVVDSGCRLRSATRRPFRSSRPDVNVDVDSRRREISLGNRPVDCTIGSVVSVCSSSAVDGFASAVRQFICRSCRRFECLSFRFFCWWLSSCLFGWWYVFLLSSKSGALACCWCLRSTIVVGSSSSSDGFVSAGRLSVVRTVGHSRPISTEYTAMDEAYHPQRASSMAKQVKKKGKHPALNSNHGSGSTSDENLIVYIPRRPMLETVS
ncbi:uncharacterized protein LOC125525541 isoform X3 [Triticum urartu]|uniref:uncharacterized protein LOC125525541 isoform X3 n=1 Tax=Triticum urartu TaxID=4572 RepID=UPI002044321F|nr:uncharacterized protein LOC125525541 isoform X3 [Triticum urartu]